MLYAFGFERIGVLVSDLYFVDPDPAPGQEGPEHGVRLEVRMLEQGELTGSIYSSRPIQAGQPIWRADLLKSLDSPPGRLNRAHHHPGFHGWEPGKRVFDKGLSAHPVVWVGEQLADLGALLEWAGVEPAEDFAADTEDLRGAVHEITAVLGSLLARVESGELAVGPSGGQPESARLSWL